MPKSKEATTSTVETEPQAPKPFGFEEAFDDLGVSTKDLIRSRVSSVPPKVDYGQASEQVNSIMRQYKALGESLFTAARVSNANRPGTLPGRDINSLATADAALPGMSEYMQLVRTKIDAYKPGDTLHLPSEDEQAFMDAMEWSALREQRLAAPQEITALDYQDSPHDPPYDNYDTAQQNAIDILIAEAETKHTEAIDKKDVVLIADRKKVIDDLKLYRSTYATATPTNTLDRDAASKYRKGLMGYGPNPTPDAMNNQANLDRVFATYDSQIKTLMKNELDKKDIENYAELQGIVGAAQNILADQAADDLRRFNSSDNPLPGQAAYDAVSAELGLQELRIAKRIGVPTDGGFGEKLTSAAQVGPFLATMHGARSTNLDAKIAIQVASKRNLLDSAADFMAGKTSDGEKEKRKGKIFLRRALKVGAFAAMASFGPLGFAGAMGAMVGVSKLSKTYSNHSHELQSRTTGIDINKVTLIANDPSLTPADRMKQMRELEVQERTKDRLFQQSRRRKDVGKAAAWGAGIAFAPIYAPLFAGTIPDAFSSGWELTQWTAGRIF